MSNSEHIKRLDEKVQLYRIKRRCGYIVVLLVVIIVAMIAAMWVHVQMMSQIIYQQEDGLDQLMEIRNSVDSIVEATVIIADEPEAVPLGEFEITHYCVCEICCPGTADGITATGTVATPGRTVAADPNVIPYGTVLLIGEKEYVVEDCGGAIKGNRIDVLMESHEAALEAGRYKAEVSVKKEHQLLATADVQ